MREETGASAVAPVGFPSKSSAVRTFTGVSGGLESKFMFSSSTATGVKSKILKKWDLVGVVFIIV